MEEKREIRHPRQCIQDYCLYHCEKKERRNSRRSVSECLSASCPLWHYRTGKLKWEKSSDDMKKADRERRVKKLDSARKKAERAETNVMRAEYALKEQKQKAEEARAYVKQLESAFYVRRDPDDLWR